jgi:acylphosphatase
MPRIAPGNIPILIESRPMSMVRRRVFYSGRVQGVGFRETSRRLSCNHEVAGYVRNLPDGRVELVVEGDLPEVEALLEAIGRQFDRQIRDIQIVSEPPDEPPLSGFSVRY